MIFSSIKKFEIEYSSRLYIVFPRDPCCFRLVETKIGNGYVYEAKTELKGKGRWGRGGQEGRGRGAEEGNEDSRQDYNVLYEYYEVPEHLT